MGIDVDALVAEWKKKKAESDAEVSRSMELRRQRAIERNRERTQNLEGYYRRKFARIAEIVSGNALPSGIIDWLRHDSWTVNEGLTLLCGFDPENVQFDEIGNASTSRCPSGTSDSIQRRKSIRNLYGLVLYDPLTIQVVGEESVWYENFNFLRLHAELLRVWRSGEHNNPRYAPTYFVEWASRKDFSVPWLEYVQQQGYFLQPAAIEQDLNAKSQAAHINIIGALCDLYWKATHPGEKYSQASMLEALEAYKDYPGCGETNLKKKLTAAMNAIHMK